MRRTLRNRPVDRAYNLAYAPGAGDAGNVGAAFASFTARHLQEIRDSGELPKLIEATRETERAARRVRHWLESLAGDTQERHCLCGAVLRGRADQKFCSAACRQRAHRSRV